MDKQQKGNRGKASRFKSSSLCEEKIKGMKYSKSKMNEVTANVSQIVHYKPKKLQKMDKFKTEAPNKFFF